MEVIYILLGVSLLVASGFLVAFLVATAKGQFDDDETPAHRILFDDENQEASRKKWPTKNNSKRQR